MLRKNVVWMASMVFVLAAFFGAPPAQAGVDYVIHITVDALRGDLLKNLVANTPATYPNFKRLQDQSAFTYNARTDFNFTETIPNHVSVITGRPVNQPTGQPNTVHHGYSNNFPGATHTLHANGNPNLPYVSSVFDVVHDNGLSTALYASKTRLAILDRSYNATYGGLDTIGVNNGRDKIDFSTLVDGGSAGIVNSLVTNMAAASKNYTLLHLVEPDTVGHATGWGNAAWNASVGVIDSRLGQLFTLIDNNATLRDHTAIILTADHGGGVGVHTTATAWENYNIPLYVWGAGLPMGSDLYSISTNRFDPALLRPDYNAAMQPFRNGDTANMALSLLGLGPIPGSSMIPTLIPEPATLLLVCGMAAAALRRRGRN